MVRILRRYADWLQAGNPTGEVERLPEVRPDGSTRVPGLYLVGDLSGIPLLKFSTQSGADVLRHIADELEAGRDRGGDAAYDVIIVGAGVAGIAAALEAQRRDLEHLVLESSDTFSTIRNFPRGKPIYLYPNDMDPDSPLTVSAEVKESLLDELERQRSDGAVNVRTGAKVSHVRRRGGVFQVHTEDGEPLTARRVVLAIGRSGNYRKLDVPGEDLNKVYNRLHDPKDFRGQNVLVVGGGDSALETAIALAECGATVWLSYRKAEFSRPKPENQERINELADDEARAGRVKLLMPTNVKRIEAEQVVVDDDAGSERTVPNDSVFTMIGREPPLDFLRRSGVRISGDWTPWSIAAFAAFLLFCTWLYLWKGNVELGGFNFARTFDVIKHIPAATGWTDKHTLLGTIAASAAGATFWYTLAYCTAVVAFGVARMRRRRTQYVTLQTWALMAIQVIPLFILPEILLPYLGRNGWLPAFVETSLFPNNEYWRAYGFILAWPLFFWNLVTEQPLWGWWVIGIVQSFLIIPLLIWKFGKGVYCGWICSCGALAETLGDAHRHKAPHGPVAKRFDLAGQVVLGIAFVVLLLRGITWIPGVEIGVLDTAFAWGRGSYKFVVDLVLAGIIGVAFYFWFSGRTWCRFFCPLAALMHIYAKFTRYRILSDKKRCISCNVCTSVCHMGIDVMNYANKGRPMDDVQCVRCSACVQSCPTGVLYFGEVDRGGNVIRLPILKASPVRDYQDRGELDHSPEDPRYRPQGHAAEG